MTNDDKDLNPAINTDQTIYRQPTTDYGPEDGNDKGMEPSVFVTKEGAVGFNHYGKCVVKPIKEWVEMAWNTPQQPNGYDMDGNPIQHRLSGGPQQPSEPLKELDKEELWKENYKAVWDALDLVWEAINEISPMPSQESLLPPEPGRYAEEMVKAVAKFGQPSEKKALSLVEIGKILRDLKDTPTDHLGSYFPVTIEELAKHIHSTLPAQREVR